MMTFGQRLVYSRQRRGYNQKRFAEALGITATRLNYWEKDKRQPDVLMIRRILEVLHVSGDWLLGLADSMDENELNEELHALMLRVKSLDRSRQREVVAFVEYKGYQQQQERLTAKQKDVVLLSDQ